MKNKHNLPFFLKLLCLNIIFMAGVAFLLPAITFAASASGPGPKGGGQCVSTYNLFGAQEQPTSSSRSGKTISLNDFVIIQQALRAAYSACGGCLRNSSGYANCGTQGWSTVYQGDFAKGKTVKAAHMNELRRAISTLLGTNGTTVNGVTTIQNSDLPTSVTSAGIFLTGNVTFTDDPAVRGTPIKAQHITELINDLQNIQSDSTCTGQFPANATACPNNQPASSINTYTIVGSAASCIAGTCEAYCNTGYINQGGVCTAPSMCGSPPTMSTLTNSCGDYEFPVNCGSAGPCPDGYSCQQTAYNLASCPVWDSCPDPSCPATSLVCNQDPTCSCGVATNDQIAEAKLKEGNLMAIWAAEGNYYAKYNTYFQGEMLGDYNSALNLSLSDPSSPVYECDFNKNTTTLNCESNVTLWGNIFPNFYCKNGGQNMLGIAFTETPPNPDSSSSPQVLSCGISTVDLPFFDFTLWDGYPYTPTTCPIVE